MKRFSLLMAFALCCSIATNAAPTVAPAPPPPRPRVGNIPAGDRPVSFGIPFRRGEMRPADAFVLTTAGGEAVAADFWPTAYWPDGSVKWGGFAAVIPGGTESVTFTLTGKKKTRPHIAGSDVSARTPATTSAPAVSTQGGVSGGGPLGGAASTLSVSEAAAQLCINTGSLQAFISRSGHAILDSLVLDGCRVAGAARLVCATQDQPYAEALSNIAFRNYVASIDSARVERAGKVRAVVKIDGKYGGADRAFLPFTVRLYFYAGSEQVRMVHTFIYNGDEHRDFIRSLGVRFEVPMREQAYNRHVAFATQDGGVWAESVQPLNGRRVLGDGTPERLQVAGQRVPEPETFDERGRDLIRHWARWNTFRLSQPNDQGYTIQKRAHEGNMWIGTHTGHRAAGYAFAGDVSGGLGVSMKDFWESYPASLRVDSATHDVAFLTAYLWSPDAGPMDLRHYDNVAHDLNASYEDVQPGMSTPNGIARTSTLMLMPERAYPGRAAVAARAQQQAEDAPLVCTPEYLHSRRAFGVWSLPDTGNPRRAKVEALLKDYLDFYVRAVDERHWYGFWNYGDFMHGYDPDRHEWKYDVGGFAWDNTELGSISWLWYSFLRTARPDVWRMAEAMTRHCMEVDVYHSGPFAGLGSRHNVSHWGCGAKEARISQAAWNRFYYYLTTDERTGDLMTATRDADQMLYTIDPMRLALPREKYPCTAPARLRIGPDWVAYAGNWMTEYERTLNPKYRRKIEAGMKSIAALPNGMFTGPGVLGYDPATGILSWEGDRNEISTNHLKLIMGGFELMHEMLEMVPNKKFAAAYLDHNARYHKVTKNRFRISRLKGYGAAHLKDRAEARRLADEVWQDMWLYNTKEQHYRFSPRQLMPPEVPQPLIESPETTTNDCALWSLDAIYLLEAVPLD